MDYIYWIIIGIEAIIILLFLLHILRRRNTLSELVDKSQALKSRSIDFGDVELHGGTDSQINIMAEALNSVKNNMQAFLEASKENVVVLSDAIEILDANAKTNKEGSKRIAESLNAVVSTIDEQSDLVKSSLGLIEENSVKISEIEKATKEIGILLNDTVDSCKQGMDLIAACEGNMTSVSDNLSRSQQLLVEFVNGIHEINAIGSFISDISHKLNLLSLNASIEAARAGEAGKGFSVVAKEMSVMAGKTSESISNINDIVSSVISSSEKVKACISDSVTVFSESNTAFDDLSASFKSIDLKSVSINDMMKDIYSRIENINRNSMESSDRADKASAASEMVALGMHDIEQVSKETAGASAKMTENIDALDSMLFGLKNLLKRYKESVLPVEVRPGRKIKIGVHCILDNSFWHSVRRGVIYAKNELESLGAEVRYLSYTNWDDTANLPGDFKKMLDENFDGFICPGFMANTPERLGLAHDMGKKVFLFNCDTDNVTMRDAVFQPDSFDSGRVAATEIIKAIKKNGRVAVLHGPLHVAVNKLRADGFKDKINSTKGFKLLEAVKVDNTDEDTYFQASELIRKHPDLNGLFITSGTPIPAAKAIEDSGRDIKLVVFDHSKKIFEYIKKGIIVAAIGQDPFGQGHDPIIHMYNSIVTGEPIPQDKLKCRLNIVDRNNVDSMMDA